MWRQFKRQVRQWGLEMNGKWQELTVFYRIVASFAVIMAMALAFRTLFLDPQEEALKAVEKELSSQHVPFRVPALEEDDEIIGLNMKVESLQKSLDRILEEEKDAIAVLRPMRLSQASEAVTAMGRIVSGAGLRVVRFHEIRDSDSGGGNAKKKKGEKAGKQAEASPDSSSPAGLKLLRQRYDLLGTFGGVYDFLHGVDDLPWPFKFSNVSISAVPSVSGKSRFANSRVLVRLSFVQTFYCYDYDRLK